MESGDLIADGKPARDMRLTDFIYPRFANIVLLGEFMSFSSSLALCYNFGIA